MTDIVDRLQNWRREMERSCDAMRSLGPEMEEAALGNAYVAEALEDAADEILSLRARIEELERALEASGETKAAYMGEFSFNIIETAFDDVAEEFVEYPRKVYVPWDTIKEIMAAIRARAAIGKAKP